MSELKKINEKININQISIEEVLGGMDIAISILEDRILKLEQQIESIKDNLDFLNKNVK